MGTHVPLASPVSHTQGPGNQGRLPREGGTWSGTRLDQRQALWAWVSLPPDTSALSFQTLNRMVLPRFMAGQSWGTD